MTDFRGSGPHFSRLAAHGCAPRPLNEWRRKQRVEGDERFLPPRDLVFLRSDPAHRPPLKTRRDALFQFDSGMECPFIACPFMLDTSVFPSDVLSA